MVKADWIWLRDINRRNPFQKRAVFEGITPKSRTRRSTVPEVNLRSLSMVMLPPP